MKLLATILFEPEEVQVIERALQGHEHAIPGNSLRGLWFPVRSYLHRVRQEEPLDLNDLDNLGDVLDELIYEWQAEVTPEEWRALGAPGSDEAVSGLALERRLAIDRAVAARVLLADALTKALGASPERRVTRSERRSAEA